MGSYGIIIKTEEIRRRVQNGDYASAQQIIDTMPLKKIKNTADLGLFAEVYIQNKKYDEAMELLYRIYKKSKTRRTLEHMVIASIGRNNIEEAEKFLNEYRDLAPNDYNYYIYRYKIDKLKKEPYNVLIDSLVQLKQQIYLEKWMYELAKLYYKAGMKKECIQECSDIILIFGEGSYVEKAKILKAYYSGEIGKDEIIDKLKTIANKDITDQDTQTDLKLGLDKQDRNNVYGTQDESKEIPVNIAADEEINDDMLNEIADNMRREVSSLLESEQNPETAEKVTDQDRDEELYRMDEMIFGGMNEDLERLDKLSESLNVNLRYIFSNFIHVRGLQKQLADSLELIDDKSTDSVQMIITGAPSSGKTTLAKNMAIFLNITGKLKSSKTVIIPALKLDNLDITKISKEIRDCCLIIEDAGCMKRPDADKLLELIRYCGGDIAVVLEDNNDNFDHLYKENPEFAESFKNRIHIPPYSEDDLIRFAYADMVLRGYELHPSAVEPFKKGLQDIIKNEKEKALEKISMYIHSAMLAADIRTGKRLTGIINDNRFADVKIVSLMPEDFTCMII